MYVDFVLVFLIRSFQQFFRILPESMQCATGVMLGRVAFLLFSQRRKIAIANIKRAFSDLSEEKARDMAKSCFEKLGLNVVEILLLSYLPKEEYRERFEIENRAYVDEALKLGSGVLALVFHYANWEIMGVASHFLSQDILVLGRPLKGHAYLNSFLNKLRSFPGLTMVPNKNTGKDVIRYLNENKIVAILGDQREKRSKAVYVDFFGEKVPTSKGIAAIAMKTGAPVIPFYFERKGFLRYKIVCNEPLVMERRGDIGALIANNTRKINAFLESIITKHPDEWFWVHRRWGRDS